MRLFTAIELGDEAGATAGVLVEALRKRAEAIAPRARIAWVSPDRMHLTVRFIGEIDDSGVERVVQALRMPLRIEPFVIRWGAPGAFPERGAPRVLWLGIESGVESLAALESMVSGRLEGIGISRQEQAYRPHLTLARIRDPGGLRAAALFEGGAPRPGRTAVRAITLFQSRLSPKGSAYVALQQTPLRV